VTALLVLIGLLAGLVLGWYLRRINTWCPSCGDTLACTGCGRSPTASRVSEASRVAR
jgi:hypothetical protein